MNKYDMARKILEMALDDFDNDVINRITSEETQSLLDLFIMMNDVCTLNYHKIVTAAIARLKKLREEEGNDSDN